MAETSLTWRKKHVQIQEAQIFKKDEYKNRLILRHIIIKSSENTRRKILKAAREKQLGTYKETHIKLSDFFFSSFAGQKRLKYVFKLVKEKKKNLPPKNNLPSKAVLKN